MNQPWKKAALPTSGRAAHSRATSSVGFSTGQVRQQLHRPTLAQPLAPAYSAQEQRYQQLLRSGRAFARPEATRQDGAVAYHAQALQRAEAQYRAQVAHRLLLERSFAAQLAHDQTYISQGGTETEHQQGRALAIQHKIEQNTRDMVQGQPEAAGIASGVVVGMAVASQVVAPELLAARLASTARWLGVARRAVVLERVAQGLSYQAGSLSGTVTWQGIKQAGGVFAGRAFTDGLLQYTGSVYYNTIKYQSSGEDVGALDIAWLSVNDVSISSMFMSGLPGDSFKHSVRNALVANAVEWKLNGGTLMSFKFAEFGTGRDVLNYTQKVGLSIGADYLAGRYSGRIQRAYDGTRLVRPIGSRYDPLVVAEWRQTRSLLNTLQVGQYPIKIAGGVLGSIIEPVILPTPPQP
ncbi:MAG: hypothetical protein EOO55_02815 [Hymenobacter sp.]|nr:MAG: hypothetical protein EOO55_02815 [Hymenobacter sp.]